MRHFRGGLWLAFVMVLAGLSVAQEPSVPEKEHAFLQHFAGEWTSESEMMAGPGVPASKTKGSMKSKRIGELWVVNEIKADMDGKEMHGIQTIGFDPKKKKYVGTWIDSMVNLMWQYEGTVDAAGKTLSLEADGPNWTEPGKTARFRDSLEIKSKDEILMTSAMQVQGKWVTFMTSKLTRKK